MFFEYKKTKTKQDKRQANITIILNQEVKMRLLINNYLILNTRVTIAQDIVSSTY
jgi:hypothetical protein